MKAVTNLMPETKEVKHRQQSAWYEDYSEGSRRSHLLPTSRLDRASPIHALQVQGGTLQGVGVPQKPWPNPPHQDWLANLAELLLEDPARAQRE